MAPAATASATRSSWDVSSASRPGVAWLGAPPQLPQLPQLPLSPRLGAELGEDADGAGDGSAESADPPADGSAAAGTGSCAAQGPDAYLMISLSGAVDEQVDWDAAGIDCSGSAVTALTLGWASPDLELRLAQIPLGGGETGSGLPATLAINVAETSYSTERKGCTVDISSNEPVNEFVHLVEGSGSCGPLTEIGGDGTITVDGDFSFATYVLV